MLTTTDVVRLTGLTRRQVQHLADDGVLGPVARPKVHGKVRLRFYEQSVHVFMERLMTEQFSQESKQIKLILTFTSRTGEVHSALTAQRQELRAICQDKLIELENALDTLLQADSLKATA